VKAHLILILVSALLACCAETTVVKPDGTVLVNGGVWTKAKGRAMMAKVTRPDGTKIEIKNVTEEPDGVIGPQGAIDGVVSGVVAKAWAGESKNASNNEAGVANTKTTTEAGIKHHELDNQGLEITGKNKVNELKATPKS
jgi:hypothetical protein